MNENEDSKDMARAGSAGMEWHLALEKGADREEVRIIMEQWLSAISKELIGGRPMLGHIKAVLRFADGWMRANLVDPRLSMDVEGEMDGVLIEGDMKVMAALVGMSDREVMDGISRGTDEFLRQRSGMKVIRADGRKFVRLEG